jgi:hypothetical protein
MPKRSILDGVERDLCMSCQAMNAQPVAVVVRAVAAHGWGDLPQWKRMAARVWHSDSYMRVGDWARLMAHQSVTVYRGKATLDELAEEEAQLARTLDAMKAAARTRPQRIQHPNPPRRFWRTAWQAALWCLGFEPARSAV